MNNLNPHTFQEYAVIQYDRSLMECIREETRIQAVNTVLEALSASPRRIDDEIVWKCLAEAAHAAAWGGELHEELNRRLDILDDWLIASGNGPDKS
jgi:hypothetical protein